jgi:aryl-alcohol dehydrogenase-like predicted oxidoreductase
MGGEWKFGWGHQDDDESIAAIHHALDQGINWIDTAAIYGLGHSEEVLGKALKGRSDKPYIFTKGQRRWGEDRQPYDSMREFRYEVEQSLRRLNIDVIDLYQIHWPRPDEDIELGWSTLAQLQEEGKVRYIGVSNFNTEQMQRAQAVAPVTSLQPPYSLINPGVQDEILPFCRDHNIGVIAYSPMGSGLLTGKVSREWVDSLDETDWRRRSDNFKEPRLSRNLQVVEILREIGEAHDTTPAQVAIAWVLANPAGTGAIVGVRRPDQVDGIIGGADVNLSDADIQRLNQFITAHP